MMTRRIAIIGAGPSGLCTLKNLLQEKVGSVTLFEKNNDIGGNWLYSEEEGHSSVYETTHIISSKTFSEYPDYPMPESYPDYPSHRQLLTYFRSYAQHFKLYPHIALEQEVLTAKPTAKGQWHLTIRSGTEVKEEVFDFLCVANGHHWDAAIPELPGNFDGPILHSHQFKKAEPYRDQKVLVVGGGNSACDVAVETARVSEKTVISIRSGQYIMPKFIFGVPPDKLNLRTSWIPDFIRQYLFKWMLRLVQGPNKNYGLQEPDCLPLEMHPTLNSELLYAIRHGTVLPQPGIESCDGKTVTFKNGEKDEFDVIICATGYHISFPFFDSSLFDFKNKLQVPLYRKMIPEEFDNLFFIGLFQPQGCIWPAADLQAQLAAKAIKGSWRRPRDLKQRIEQEMHHPHFRWKATARHSIEVDYHRFRAELKKEIAA